MNRKTLLFLLSTFIFNFFLAHQALANQQTVYKGPIYNVFFHPLIIYPELAFVRGNKSLEHMDKWFVTVKEFKKIIPELHKRGFVLFSPKDLFNEKKDAQGQIVLTRKEIILPPGKKPLILSLDDYNFYPTMKSHGTIHRFWVNQKGQLMTITHRNQKTVVDDQEIPQLLEKFINKHRDFSYNNARGIIALTGYHGIFGYDTHKTHSAEYQSELTKVKKVVHKLKQMGWEFASHSYFHLPEKKQTPPVFEQSEKRWLHEVGGIVGPTAYYIFPFGDSWNENRTRMRFLKSAGYKYFFGVANISGTTIKPDAVVMDRFPMDGRSLREIYGGSKVFVNPTEILDSSRLAKIK